MKKLQVPAPASLPLIVKFIERQLCPCEIADWPGAFNGLHVENSGRILRVCAAVDAHEPTLAAAAEKRDTLLLVHHGLMWNQPRPWTGPSYRMLKLCIEKNLAVYSSHLPLDMHPVLGNNACLARTLKLGRTRPFGTAKGQLIGLRAQVNLDRDTLAARLEKAVGGPVQTIPGGPEQVRRVGVVTGGGASCLEEAATEGLDTLITGEASHASFAQALELGVNLMLAGHYATETFGVIALAKVIARRFRIPWEFIDCPSGL